MERVGTRASVMYGLAKMTGGGLTKDDLMYNEKGKIVSKKKSMMARKNMRGGSGSGFVTRHERKNKIENKKKIEESKKFAQKLLKGLEEEKISSQFENRETLFRKRKSRRTKLIDTLKSMRNKKNLEYLHSNSYIHTKIDTNDIKSLTNDIKSLINVKIFNNDWLSMIHDSDIFFVDKFIDKLKKNNILKEIINNTFRYQQRTNITEYQDFYERLAYLEFFVDENTNTNKIEKIRKELNEININKYSYLDKGIFLELRGVGKGSIPGANYRKIKNKLLIKISNIFNIILQNILKKLRAKSLNPKQSLEKKERNQLQDLSKIKTSNKSELIKKILETNHVFKHTKNILIRKNGRIEYNYDESQLNSQLDLKILDNTAFFNFLGMYKLVGIDSISIKYESVDVKIQNLLDVWEKNKSTSKNKSTAKNKNTANSNEYKLTIKNNNNVYTNNNNELVGSTSLSSNSLSENTISNFLNKKLNTVNDVFKLMRGDYNTRSGGIFPITIDEKFIEFKQALKLKNGKYILESTGGESIYFDYNTLYGWHWLIKNKEEAIYYIQAQINEAKPILTTKNSLIEIKNINN